MVLLKSIMHVQTKTWIIKLSMLIFASLLLMTQVCNSEDSRSNFNRKRRQCSWLCPCIRCPTLYNCARSESIVYFRTFRDDRGNIVEVRCESCQYCLDYESRDKRSVQTLDNIGLVKQAICSSETMCPPLPSHCRDVRDTTVYLGDTLCRQCPACYDYSVLAQLHEN